VYARLRGSHSPPPLGVRYRCSQLIRDAMLWVHMHNMFLSGTDFWWYLDKAYNSVPGSGGSNPLHAIPCVHGLTLPRRVEEVGVSADGSATASTSGPAAHLQRRALISTDFLKS
jgi:hypothetical protein